MPIDYLKNAIVFEVRVPWKSSDLAFPLSDLCLDHQTIGSRIKFNGKAVVFMNQSTANRLVQVTNPAGWKPFLSPLEAARVPCQGGAIQAVRDILKAKDLPQLGIFEDVELDSDGFYKTLIKEGDVVVVGYDPGANRPAPDPQDFRWTMSVADGVWGIVVVLKV